MEIIEINDIEIEELDIEELEPEDMKVEEIIIKETREITIEKTIKEVGKPGKNGIDGKTPTKTQLKALIKEAFPEDKLLQKVIAKIPKEEVENIEIGEDRGGKYLKKGDKKMYLTSGIGPVMSTGVHDFLHLTDAPSSYEGQAGKVVKVKSDETGLEFATSTGGGGLNSFTSPDDSLTIGGTLTDPTAEINYAHAGTYTASQTFMEDTIFSGVAPLNGYALKLVSYLQDDVLYDASWTLGHGNFLSVPDTNQVIIGNNNSMTGFLGFISGIGNTSTGTEDVFINGMNNTVTGTSGGAVSGISNTLSNGATVYVQGINNNTGAFSNQFISGLTCTTSADNTFAIGNTLTNSLTNSLDIGMSDATKTTLTTTYARFRTDVGIGTIPSAGLHVLKTTEQLRLGYDSSNYVTQTISSGGLLSWQTTAGAKAGIYTLTPHGAGGAGTNRTINFGSAYGNAALWLYNAGSSGTRYGWGMQNDTMQFFVATGTGKKFTFNYGGDLQSTGSNELLRLTQYGSGGGGLGMGATATDPKTPHRIDFAGVTAANATVGTEDILRFSRIFNNGVSYPQAFTIAIGRYVAPTSFSPNTSIDFRLKDDSTNNITTNNGVMSFNSNKRVLIGANGAASATAHIQQATLGTEVFRMESIATNDDPSERVFQNRATTTDATVTTLHTVTITASNTYTIEADVVARRTGGSAGTAEDGASYKVVATVKNVAGTATIIGAVNQLVVQEDQAGWDATIDVTAGTARVIVTGATNNNVTWHLTLRTRQVSS